MIKNFGMLTFGVSAIVTGIVMVTGGVTFFREGLNHG